MSLLHTKNLASDRYPTRNNPLMGMAISVQEVESYGKGPGGVGDSRRAGIISDLTNVT